MMFLGELDVQETEELDIETDIGTKLDTMSLGRASSINTAEYTQSYQNKILPISLRNPMSLSQYQNRRQTLKGAGRDRSFACTTDLRTQIYVKSEIFRGASLDFS